MGGYRSVPAPNALRDSALMEEEALKNRINLEIQSDESEHIRSEKARNLFAAGVRWLMIIIIFLLIVTIIVVAWHHLTPDCLHWLSESQLGQLRTVIFSSAIIGAVSAQIQRYGS